MSMGLKAKLMYPYHSPDNYIDGKEFEVLTESDVKNMIPAIGVYKKVL